MRPFTLREFHSIRTCPSITFQNAMAYHGAVAKEHEYDDFADMCEIILNKNSQIDIDGWFIGTDLNIVPDFDLLRFTSDKVINVELKHQDGRLKFDNLENKFTRQNHILKLIELPILYFVYLADERCFLQYDGNLFHDISLDTFLTAIEPEKKGSSINSVELLTPNDYLISPINDSEKFFEGKYFLTSSQQECISKIMSTKGLVGVSGTAGSGKTLIAYDLLRKLDGSKKVLFIFAGNLRQTHIEISNRFQTVVFASAKNIHFQNMEQFDYVIIDESQRLHSWERSKILSSAEQNKKNTTTVFLFDIGQTLGPKDSGQLLQNLFRTYQSDGKAEIINLSSNLRSNKYIAAFVKQLKSLSKVPGKNVDIQKLRDSINVKYFKTADDSKPWIRSLIKQNYTFLVPTGDNRNAASCDQFWDIESTNCHSIIGSEIDNVVTYIDSAVGYSQQGILEKRNGEYYFIDNELYVNLSRARQNLSVAVIGNSDVYNAIFDVIFQFSQFQKVSKEIH